MQEIKLDDAKSIAVEDKETKDQFNSFVLSSVEKGHKELVETGILASDIQLLSGMVCVLSQYLSTITAPEIANQHLDNCKLAIEAQAEKMKKSLN